MIKKGHPPDVAEETVSWMKAQGLLNDERRVKSHVEQLGVSGKHGKQKLRERLLAEGIDEAIVDSAIEAIPDEVELGSMKKLLRKRKFLPGERAKAGRFLAGRMFSEDNIERALCDYFGSEGTWDD